MLSAWTLTCASDLHVHTLACQDKILPCPDLRQLPDVAS